MAQASVYNSYCRVSLIAVPSLKKKSENQEEKKRKNLGAEWGQTKPTSLEKTIEVCGSLHKGNYFNKIILVHSPRDERLIPTIGKTSDGVEGFEAGRHVIWSAKSLCVLELVGEKWIKMVKKK